MANANIYYEEEQQDDNEIKCPKCSYFFSSINKPYLLPCNHNLCQNCINSLNIKQNIKCPICQIYINKNSKNNFQVNISFFNLVEKILKNKIILCKKCNKIYYFKEHYDSCDQKYFTNTNEVIKEIKKLCEVCFILIKDEDNYRNILERNKNKIYDKIKNTINIIDNKKKQEYIQFINDIFNNIGNKNIENNKKELIKFIQICKNNEKLFDNINFNEINSLLYKNSLKINKQFSENNNQVIFNTNENIKMIKSPLISNKSNSIIKISVNRHSKRNNLKNKKIRNKLNSSSDTEEEDITSNNSFIHNFPISKIQLKKHSNSPIQGNNYKKKSMILFNDLLEEFKLEKPPVNKIIIGLKNMKIIKKEINDYKKVLNSESNNKIKKVFNLNNKIKYRNIEIENIDDKYNKSVERKIQIKDILKVNNQLKENNNQINQLKENNNNLIIKKEINEIKAKINEQNNDIKFLRKSNSLISELNNLVHENEKNNIENNNQIQIINKIVKNFNIVKEITNKLNNYSKDSQYKITSFKNQITNNLNILSPKIISDYNLLIDELNYNFHQSYKRYIINFIDSSNYLSLYDTRTSITKTKNFYESMIDYYISFNHSISIEYNDNDLIFISGGINLEKNEPNDILLCLKWSNGKIEFKEKMPIKRAFHSSIYFNGNLYLIGGLGENQIQINECDLYNIKERKWEKIPKLNIPRQNSTLCIYNNSLLFVIRGSNGKELLDTIEYINLNNLNNGFNIIKPKDFGLSWFGCESSMAITINKNQILIFGGKDKFGKLYHHSFFYDPMNNFIFRGKEIKVSACFKCNGTIFDNKVICIDYKNTTNTKYSGVHKYDISLKKWYFE